MDVSQNTFSFPVPSGYLHDIFDQQSQPVLILSLDGQILFANLAFLNCTKGSLQDFTAKNFENIFYCEARQWTHLIETDDPAPLQMKEQPGDENAVCQFKIDHFSILPGDIYLLFLNSQDKLPEKEQHQNWKAIFNGTDKPFFLLAPDFSVLTLNDAAVKHLGLFSVQEQVTGKNILDFIKTKEDKTLFKKHLTMAVEGKSSTLTRCQQVSGSETWSLYHFTPIANEAGSFTGVTVIVDDITSQKKSEQSLEEKQRQLTTLMSNLPGMAFRCANDADWTMEFVSQGSFQLTGYRPEDLIGNRKISFGRIIHPDDQEMVWKNVQAALKNQKSYELEYRIFTALGKIRWVWERGQGIFDTAGKLQALEGFIIDVTERVRSEIAAERALAQAEALQEAMAELSSELDLSQVLRRILISLKKVLPFNSATLFLWKAENLTVVAARGFSNTSRLINKTFPADNLLLEEIRKSKKPLILSDAQKDPRFSNWGGADYVRGWMGVPLIRHDHFIGLLTIDNYKPDAYSAEDSDLARTFAAEAAIVIENARLYEKAQQLASTDSLTGIYNRRYFYDIAAREFSRAKRYHTQLSVIMIDIDHFKYVNDRYGHSAGDKVLVQFVDRINDALRSSDIFARYGGEEFVVLLPNIDQEHALQAAERLRLITADQPFKMENATPFITISLGVAEVDESCDLLDILIDRGDKALYEAKQIGRNRARGWQSNKKQK